MSELKEMTERINTWSFEGNYRITEIPFPLYLGKENGELLIKYNGFSCTNFKFRYEEIGKIIDSARQYDSAEEGVAREYLRWLNLEERYPGCHWLGTVPESRYKKLLAVIESYCEKDLTKEDFTEFRRKVLEVHNEIEGEDKWREDRSMPQMTKINDFFMKCKVGYRVVPYKNPAYYRLERG